MLYIPPFSLQSLQYASPCSYLFMCQIELIKELIFFRLSFTWHFCFVLLLVVYMHILFAFTVSALEKFK